MYRLWFLVALVFSIIDVSVWFVKKNSIEAKNFEKIWYYYDVSLNKFRNDEKIKNQKKVYAILGSIILSFLSWVAVWIFVIRWIISLINSVKRPDKLKEIMYMIQNKDLKKSEMENLIREYNKFNWDSYSLDTDDDEEYEYALEDDWDDKSSVTLDINWKTLYRYRYSLFTEYEEFDQYKLKWYEIYLKCIEYKIVEPWTEWLFVKNWIVLESEIKKYEKEFSDFLNKRQIKDEQIEEINAYKKKVKWFRLNNKEVCAFLQIFSLVKRYWEISIAETMTIWTNCEMKIVSRYAKYRK